MIHDGLARLKLRTNDSIDNLFVKSSVGSPYILQYLLLESSKQTIANEVDEIVEEYIKDALRSYSETKAQRMIHQFRTACETVGEIKYRKQILLAMSMIEDEYVTMEQIIKVINENTGRSIKSTDISGSLRDLKSEKYGFILKDVEYPFGGRVHNYSTFSDPAMKFIIRWIEENKISE